MAAKTFTISAPGPTAGQQLDEETTSVYIRGNLAGSLLFVEASPTDSNYVPVASALPLEPNMVASITIPSAWYARCNTSASGAVANATVIIA